MRKRTLFISLLCLFVSSPPSSVHDLDISLSKTSWRMSQFLNCSWQKGKWATRRCGTGAISEEKQKDENVCDDVSRRCDTVSQIVNWIKQTYSTVKKSSAIPRLTSTEPKFLLRFFFRHLLLFHSFSVQSLNLTILMCFCLFKLTYQSLKHSVPCLHITSNLENNLF